MRSIHQEYRLHRHRRNQQTFLCNARTENFLRPTASPLLHEMRILQPFSQHSSNVAAMAADACASHVLRSKTCRSSPRPISIGQLNALLHLHLRPINHVVYMGSYPLLVGYLIFGRVSRLDAFSVYLIRT